MAIEPAEPSPLDYRAPGARRPMARWMIVTAIGAVIALAGVVVFLAAHAITTPAAGWNPVEQRLHEALWAAFGIALLVVGGLVAAVGLMSWCRQSAG